MYYVPFILIRFENEIVMSIPKHPKIYSPSISIIQFSIFPSPSSQCIVYPLILDCTVNDMLDIKLGDLEV